MRPIWTGYITGDRGTGGIAAIWGNGLPTKPKASSDKEEEKLVAELMRENKELLRENKELAEMNNTLRREYKILKNKLREALET